MFSRIRKHFNPTTAVAFVALVFAMTGGAFAMSAHSSGGGSATATVAKSKPKAKAGPRGPAGPAGKTGAAGTPGAQGPQGPQGPVGTKGETGGTGTNGTNGANGANGKNGATGPAGAKGTTGAAGSTGATGQTGFTETLPEGKTETGVWAVRGTVKTEGERLVTTISFPIPLKTASGVHFVGIGETAPPEQCGSGSIAHPEAVPGELCLYAAKSLFDEEGLENPIALDPAGGGGGAETTGVELVFTTKVGEETTTKKVGEEVSAEGTWAVTAANE